MRGLIQQRILSENTISAGEMLRTWRITNKQKEEGENQALALNIPSLCAKTNHRDMQFPIPGNETEWSRLAKVDILFYMDPRYYYTKPLFYPGVQSWVFLSLSLILCLKKPCGFFPLLKTTHCVLSVWILASYEINKAQMTKKCILISTFQVEKCCVPWQVLQKQTS